MELMKKLMTPGVTFPLEVFSKTYVCSKQDKNQQFLCVCNVIGEKNSKRYLMQRISWAIQRSNAACVMAIFYDSEALNEIYYIL